MGVKEALQVLGLNEKESAVYIALLQLGKASAYSIAIKSGLKKPTTYVVLDELVKKGLVSQIPRAKKQQYAARPPEETFAIAEEKLKTAKTILPELLAMAGTSGAPIRTRYFEGLQQVTEAYFDSLNISNGKEIVGWLSDTVLREPGNERMYKEYNPKRIKSGTRARLILPETEITRIYATKDGEMLRETRFDKTPQYKPASELLIYGENRLIITSFEETMALIIESKKIHDLLKGIFEAHWRGLAK